MRSIMQPEKDFCYVCSEAYKKYYWADDLEEHHIFFGPNRQNSERHGLKVWLCPEHHRTGDMAAHNNKLVDLWLKERAQRKFEETHDRKTFVEIFGKNWL